MLKAEVIKRFCELSDKVAEHFKHEFAADCFCGQGGIHNNQVPDENHGIAFDELIFTFINAAIDEKIQRESDLALRELILTKAQEQGIKPQESIKIIQLIMAETGMRLRDAGIWENTLYKCLGVACQLRLLLRWLLGVNLFLLLVQAFSICGGRFRRVKYA